MRIVCPKCELKGQVDVTPTGAKTRIACVRCATTFDAVYVDGEIQALLPQPGRPEAALESTATPVCAVGDVLTVSPEVDVVATSAVFASMPETPYENQFDASPQVGASPAGLEDLSTSSTDLMSGATVETAQLAPREISDELPPQRAEAQEAGTADSDADFVAAARLLKSNGAGKVSRQPSDAYGMGVRLMRVSPMWLLLVGLGFISFIVFCNWLIKPAGQPGDTASMIAAADNHATNQSARRVTPPDSIAQSPNNSQVGQPSNEPGVAFIATDAREAMPPAAPKVEAVEVKPAVEEKPVAHVSATNTPAEAKEGKVTIQVGSYNAAAEADQRVADLKSAGFEARSVKVDIPQRGTWYRVQSGRFVSRDEAERYGKQLRDKGVVSSYITTDVKE